jgi:hypothetical protein
MPKTVLSSISVLVCLIAFGLAPVHAITLPVGPGYAMTVDLGVAAPFPDTPKWSRLHPHDHDDAIEDYTSGVLASYNSGSGPPGGTWVFDITFTVTWNGTIKDEVPTHAVASQMLFVILDSRFGPELTFEGTYDLVNSGFVDGSFAVNGVPLTSGPEIVRDDTGPMSGNPEGFVADYYPSDWIGFYLPAMPDDPQTITMQWSLGETPVGDGNVFFPSALFLPIPEPGTALLLMTGVTGLAFRRRLTG